MSENVVMQARKEPDRVACWEENAAGVTHGTLTMRLIGGGDLYLEHVEVDEAWRGQGVGTRLLEMALATYRSHGEALTVRTGEWGDGWGCWNQRGAATRSCDSSRSATTSRL